MDSIFPQNNIPSTGIITKRRNPVYGRSPVFDFGKGEFKKIDGKVYIGEGEEVLKNWIEKTLRTERYRFPIYSFSYGVTLEELMVRGLPYPVLVNELKTQIGDALMQDIRISGVDEFKFTRTGNCLEIEFEVTTFDNKTINMEVKV